MGGQVVVAAGEGHLVCLEVGDGALREAGHVSLGAEVRTRAAALPGRARAPGPCACGGCRPDGGCCGVAGPSPLSMCQAREHALALLHPRLRTTHRPPPPEQPRARGGRRRGRPDRGAAPAQVACLSAAPLAGDAPAAELLAVGTWDRCLHLLRLPGLAPATPKEALGGDVIPRRWAPRASGASARGGRDVGDMTRDIGLRGTHQEAPCQSGDAGTRAMSHTDHDRFGQLCYAEVAPYTLARPARGPSGARSRGEGRRSCMPVLCGVAGAVAGGRKRGGRAARPAHLARHAVRASRWR